MQETTLPGTGGAFRPTLWTTILKARDGGGEEAREAMGRLVERYWKPLYFFVRRRGVDVEAAKDLTQAFFGRVVEKDFLRDVNPEKGRFRNWLLTAMSHFVSDQQERERALKRGGGKVMQLDVELAERQLTAQTEAPDKLFNRAWATAVIDRSVARLRREWKDEEKATEFGVLSKHLSGAAASIAETASQLKMAEHDVKNRLTKMRGRLRELIREEVASSVEDPAQVDAEMAELFAALGK